MKLSLLAFALAVSALSVSAQIKKPLPPVTKVSFAESLQAVVVTTKDWTTTSGNAQIHERSSRSSKWKSVGERFPVVVGRSGLAWAPDSAPEKAREFKKEGDGKSPAGMFHLTFVFGSAVKPEQLAFPYTRVESQTECVDDIRSNHYNKIVGRLQVGSFDWKSSEKMLEIGPQYELGVFVAYNTYPVVKGNGSCIFLHVWKDASTPTSGCTAMDRLNLERIVSRLDAVKNPYLIQLPQDEHKALRKSWNLPK